MTNRRRWILSLAACLSLAWAGCDRAGDAGAGSAVPVQVIEDCPEPCPEVGLEPVATLGDPDDPVLPRLMTQIAAAPGYFAAGLLAESGVVALYDREGTLFDVIGRYGAGPDEFRFTNVLPGPDSTVWVVDIDNQRITELDREGRVGRTLSFVGAIHQVVPLDSGRVLAGGVLSGDFRVGQPGTGNRGSPYHIMESDGSVVRSFGRWKRSRSVAPSYVAVDGAGHVFEAGGEAYSVLEMTDLGEPVRRYERRASWFPPGDNEDPEPDTPKCCHLRTDPHGRIWAITVVPTGRYRDAFDESGGHSVASFDRVRDSVLEILDPPRGRVVARTRFPQAHMGFLRGSDLVYTMRQDSVGYVYFDLWNAVERP